MLTRLVLEASHFKFELSSVKAWLFSSVTRAALAQLEWVGAFQLFYSYILQDVSFTNLNMQLVCSDRRSNRFGLSFTDFFLLPIPLELKQVYLVIGVTGAKLSFGWG